MAEVRVIVSIQVSRAHVLPVDATARIFQATNCVFFLRELSDTVRCLRRTMRVTAPSQVKPNKIVHTRNVIVHGVIVDDRRQDLETTACADRWACGQSGVEMFGIIEVGGLRLSHSNTCLCTGDLSRPSLEGADDH